MRAHRWLESERPWESTWKRTVGGFLFGVWYLVMVGTFSTYPCIYIVIMFASLVRHFRDRKGDIMALV